MSLNNSVCLFILVIFPGPCYATPDINPPPYSGVLWDTLYLYCWRKCRKTPDCIAFATNTQKDTKKCEFYGDYNKLKFNFDAVNDGTICTVLTKSNTTYHISL